VRRLPEQEIGLGEDLLRTRILEAERFGTIAGPARAKEGFAITASGDRAGEFRLSPP
jgi:hypothetical protein